MLKMNMEICHCCEHREMLIVVNSPRSFYKTLEYILNENTSGHVKEENPITDKLEGLL